MNQFGLEIAVAPLASGSRRQVEIHLAGKRPLQEKVDTASYMAVRKFSTYVASYFDLDLKGQEEEFAKWLYEYLQQAAEEADQRGLKEAAEKLIASSQQQEEEAKPGQGRPVDLGGLEAWPDPVDLDEVLNECVAYIRRHIYCQPEQADAVALFCLWTHAFRWYDVLPYLLISSPTLRCGKTTLLRLVSYLASRTLAASNLTPAAVYRVIDAYQPTLIIDECDTFLEQNLELIGLINSGWSRDTAFVIRCDNDTGEPRMFSTFAPRVIAAIGRLKDTVEDRSIVITMERRPKELRLARVSRKTKEEGKVIARKFLAWVMDHQDDLRKSAELEPDLPDSLDDRQRENWRPLVILAELAGGDWPHRARRACLWTSGAKEEVATQDIGIRLLADIREVFGDDQELTPTVLISRLSEIEDAPWSTYSSGRPITPHKVALMLKRFGVKAFKRKKANYYRKSDLARVWGLYLPDQTSTTSTLDVSDYQIVTYEGGGLTETGVSGEQTSTTLSTDLKTTYNAGGGCGGLKSQNEGPDDSREVFTV